MLNNKKTATVFICIGVVAIVAAIAVSIVFRRPNSFFSTDIPKDLDDAVAVSVFSMNKVTPSDITVDGKTQHYAQLRDCERYAESECLGEGHVTLGYTDKGDSVDVYALCSTIGYGFRDGLFVDNSGSFCIPTLITFDKTDNGKYIFKEAREALDGSENIPSIKKMFPAELAKKAIAAGSDDDIRDSLHDQCDACAAAYLKAIKREAKISSLSEEDYDLLSYHGVSDDVCNKLLKLRGEYGLYLGNFEKIESGVRYVYSVSWKGDEEGNGTVTYSKKDYDTGKVIKKYTYKVEGDSFKEVKQKKKK